MVRAWVVFITLSRISGKSYFYHQTKTPMEIKRFFPRKESETDGEGSTTLYEKQAVA